MASSWIHNQFKAAEGLLEAVDRTAKQVSKKEQDALFAAAEGDELAAGRKITTMRGASPQFRPRPSSEAASAFPNRKLSASPGASLSAIRSASTEPEPSAPPAFSPQQGDSRQSSPEPSLASLFGPALQNAPRERAAKTSPPPPIQPAAQASGNVHSGPVSLKDETDVSPSKEATASIWEEAISARGSSPQPQGKQVPGQNSRTEEVSKSSPSRTGRARAARQQSPVKVNQYMRSSEGSEAAEAAGGSIEKEAAAESSKGASGADHRTVLSPPNATADAVTEAIKAASAATGTPESNEDVDGIMDASVREARLTKMVEGLKRRLEQLKAENEQLEELLRQADANATGRNGDMGRLEDLLAKAQAGESNAKAQLLEAEKSREAEVGSLEAALEAARGRASDLQSRLAAVEGNNEQLLQEREASEARMLTALREEVAAAERRLEDERFASVTMQQSFAAREQELEATLSESVASLASQQRAVEERARRLDAAEARAASMEAEVNHLRRELDSLQSQLDSHEPQQAASPGRDAQMQELRERAASLQASLTNSESQKHGLELELAHLKRDLETLHNQAVSSVNSLDMDQRLQEMTELLYQKQSQLERIAAERSAQQLAWERELASARDDAERVKRRVKTDRAASLMDGEMVVPMEDMGETYLRLANNKRVGSAVKAGAKFLDATTLTAVRFLRRYPLGRLVVFGYIVFIHFFVYLLIHHLQQRALREQHVGLHLEKP